MALSSIAQEAEILLDFIKIVAILKIQDGSHRVLVKNVNIVFSDSVGPNVSKNV